MDQQLLNAIRNKQMIEFDYGGYHRIAEPHVYGRYEVSINSWYTKLEEEAHPGGFLSGDVLMFSE